MRRLFSGPEDRHHHALLGGGLSVMQHFLSAISEVNKLIRDTQIRSWFPDFVSGSPGPVSQPTWSECSPA